MFSVRLAFFGVCVRATCLGSSSPLVRKAAPRREPDGDPAPERRHEVHGVHHEAEHVHVDERDLEGHHRLQRRHGGHPHTCGVP